ncbi:phosphatidylserine decarboxylase-related protein [Spirosoma linguale DSM 74]|uniref:Phosphatidylserine decarboxylase-related protein n=2 Tax=Spirosoma TaxID=107 RepID=D2QQF2_SPILD|nr:phosphatidylserine decarboxylase-related protein [Spirosoma linguale DSM 74]
MVLKAKPQALSPSIQALKELIEGDTVLTFLANNAFQQNGNIIEAHQATKDVPIPRIPDLETLLHAFNTILSMAPQYINDDLVGLPFSALVVGIDATLGGSTLFRLPMFNEKMKAILNEWAIFLDTPSSASGFTIDGKQWLSPTAKHQYEFDLWEKDSPTLPYWRSWDSFFTRKFLDSAKSRPIASPETNQVVICPNDGSLFCWQPQVKRKDVFWLKDMPYSLEDIFSSSVPEEDATIKQYKLAEMFEGGYVFQTYLNPYNFHRWWVPVNGEVLFDPIVIPGCFFSKVVLPDYGGATTASTPYLAEANARGLVVFKTEDYGYVCCIPLGMSEVSTVQFDEGIKQGAKVNKGDEMGMFHYGGSSFVVIYQNLPDKQLIFMDGDGNYYPQQPPPPGSSAGASNYNTNIGSQIGQWYSKCE